MSIAYTRISMPWPRLVVQHTYLPRARQSDLQQQKQQQRRYRRLDDLQPTPDLQGGGQ